MTDTVTPRLKSCPFCGAAGTMRKDDDPSYPFYATFDHERSCPMYAVPTDLFLSGAIPTDVERLWNQRAAEADQAAENARLREENEQLRRIVGSVPISAMVKKCAWPAMIWCPSDR